MSRNIDSVQGRIRHWRESVQGLSLREWRELVNAHLPPAARVSLGTVANYERVPTNGERSAPPRADFLAAIGRAFPEIRLEWLLLGDGEPTRVEARVAELGTPAGRAAADSLGGRVVEAFPDLGFLSPEASALFLGALTRYATGEPRMELSQEQILELAGDLRWLLFLPLRLWGFVHEPDYEAFSSYCVAMLHALIQALPGPGQGDPVGEYPGSLAPRLRTTAPVGLAEAGEGG